MSQRIETIEYYNDPAGFTNAVNSYTDAGWQVSSTNCFATAGEGTIETVYQAILLSPEDR